MQNRPFPPKPPNAVWWPQEVSQGKVPPRGHLAGTGEGVFRREVLVMAKATLQVSLFGFISGWILHFSLQGRGTLLPSFFLKYFPGKLFAPKSKQMAAEGL